jgi:hypothetical protein
MTGDDGYSIKIQSEWQEMTINQSKYNLNDRRWWLTNQNTIWMTGDDD